MFFLMKFDYYFLYFITFVPYFLVIVVCVSYIDWETSTLTKKQVNATNFKK